MSEPERFHIGKAVDAGANNEEKASYRVRFEQALVVVLSVMIILFILSKRIPYRPFQRVQSIGFSTLSIEDLIPATRQGGGLPRPPSLPQVPIPSEDEFLPEDETIESTQLNVLQEIPIFDGDGTGSGVSGGDGFGYGGGMGARPIRDVIPEYPAEERKQGVEGVVELAILVNEMGHVDSIRVLLNTTRSKRLEKSAIQAAMKSQYMPPRHQGKRVSRWIRRPYRFERK